MCIRDSGIWIHIHCYTKLEWHFAIVLYTNMAISLRKWKPRTKHSFEWILITTSLLFPLRYQKRGPHNFRTILTTQYLFSFLHILIFCGRQLGDYFPNEVTSTKIWVTMIPKVVVALAPIYGCCLNNLLDEWSFHKLMCFHKFHQMSLFYTFFHLSSNGALQKIRNI